jgi:4-amino-4-deoxy-L-arabinose transferase-like glycosyltransferase
MIKKFTVNPWLIFLPFLFFYGYIIIINKWPTLYGDEIRYVDFGRHLLLGYYSPPPPHINLWNGPGYPLLLAPFLALKVHALNITLMNAVYLYLAIVFLFKAIKLVSNHRVALVLCLLLAIYPNTLSILPILYTEAFTGLLVCSFIYCLTLSYAKSSARYGVAAGLILGVLTLTKVIFGYVLIVCLVGSLIFALFNKNRLTYLRSARVLVIAFIVTLPYLYYTWHLTGKILYWGNSGGMSLYWMSTPYDHEFGDWKLPELNNNQYPILFKSKEVTAILKKNHQTEIKFILKHNEVEQDELFKQAAIQNIKKHPLKFAQNYYYNFSRMLFNFPYSYSYQDGAIVGNIIRGSLILWATVISLVLTALNWRKVIYPVRFLLAIAAVYLILTGALSAYPRQLDVILPVLFFWMGFLAGQLPKVQLNFVEREDLEVISLEDLGELGVVVVG